MHVFPKGANKEPPKYDTGSLKYFKEESAGEQLYHVMQTTLVEPRLEALILSVAHEGGKVFPAASSGWVVAMVHLVETPLGRVGSAFLCQ